MGKLLLLAAMFFGLAGCATTPAIALPEATRVLGAATVYRSASGERLEIIHDSRAGIAILKLPDGTLALLPAEYVGAAGRYKDERITVWERDDGVLLWIDGNITFSGTIEK